MEVFDKVGSSDLERRELQLTIFACAAIAVLTIGIALLMYPVVFGHQQPAPDKNVRIAFYGFCALAVLLAGYLIERQRTIQRLRREMAADRRRVADTQRQASLELLKTMPNFPSFQDRLPMEFRRTVSTSNKLSVLVVLVKLPSGFPATGEGTTLLGDAAKVIARRLREQDSIYMLAPTCFGVVLPGADNETAARFSARISEGLSDAAGAANRFSCAVHVINYPTNASSATELEQSVSALMPVDNSLAALSHALVH